MSLHVVLVLALEYAHCGYVSGPNFNEIGCSLASFDKTDSSSDNIGPDLSVYIGQSEISATMLESEFFVIDAEQVEHSGP